MHPNAQTITSFYECFGKRDAEGMIACYAPQVEFSDPAFPALRGEEVFAMWRMLTSRAKDFRLEASGIEADDASGKAHWDAHYVFSKTGRQVLNRIDATFTFRDGKIIRHRDAFDFAKWTRMALGVPGYLLGWAPPFQAAVRRQADAGLREFMAKRA